MVKIIVGNNTRREEYVFANTTTIRTILEEAQVNYHVGTTCLNNNMLDGSDLDLTLADFSIDDDCDLAFLTVIENKNNAVRVVDAMGSYVIQTEFGMDDIQTCESFNPSALVLRDGERILFAVAAGEEMELSRFGICFNRERDGKCCFDVDAEDDADFAARFGDVVVYLKKIEPQVAAAMEVIEESALDVMSMIEHIG